MNPLPIFAVLPEIRETLSKRHELVLQAPPGAGKTTGVPPALLDCGWLREQKIIMLEPRRLAARAAAQRMAEQLSEAVGETVGYRIRAQTCVGPGTQIEIVTEGILTRMLLQDPALSGVGLVVFDEYHERSLDADLALALIQQGRSLFREQAPLKLLVMSATLDGARVAGLLDNAPVVASEGQAFPVDVIYDKPWTVGQDTVARVADVVLDIVRGEAGDMLVFLPGQGEIRRVHAALEGRLPKEEIKSGRVVLAPLFGDMHLTAQACAIAPSKPGVRKIVLATNIAETSLTIEGIRVVVDAGLSREPVFDPKSGMTRLQTRRVSRAGADQRRGRAGRTQAGRCFRLYSGDQYPRLQPFATAEILQADLTALALHVIRWGADHPNELEWLDPPPAAAYAQACELLEELGAIGKNERGCHRLTSHGERLSRLPMHPRLAHMILVAGPYGRTGLACDLAALLSEKDPLRGAGAAIHDRLLALMSKKADPGSGEPVDRGRVSRIKTQSRAYRRACADLGGRGGVEGADRRFSESAWAGMLLACAYPDRIAKQRENGGCEYLLKNGRAAYLGENDPLRTAGWLAVAQAGGNAGRRERIFLAAELDPGAFEHVLAAQVTTCEEVHWDDKAGRLIAQTQSRIGRIVLSRRAATVNPAQRLAALLDMIRRNGLGVLPWTEENTQWRRRVMLMRELLNTDTANVSGKNANPWPDLSDEALLRSMETWLGPYLNDVSRTEHLARLDLQAIFRATLQWRQAKQLDEWLPRDFKAPSGRQHRIDYRERPPVLAVRLQEMFGCRQSPTIAAGRIFLKLHLLSPARRPLQVTQDLAGFWENAYAQVRKEMKGRYPKHPWPEKPLDAQPTERPKPRRS